MKVNLHKMNYQEADRKVDELVQQGHFEDAHALLEMMRGEFPEHTYEITDYIVYVYLHWGRPTNALDELMHALERGHFYPVEYAFYKDQLGHLPEYTTLEKKSLELKERFQRNSRSRWEAFAPTVTTEKPLPVLVLLHGDGQNIETIKSSWPPHSFVEMGYLVMYIQSSHVLKFNGYSWTIEFELARLEVKRALEEVAGEYQIDMHQIVLGGFSGGAMIALDITLRQEIPVARCIAISPSSGDYLEQSHVGMTSLAKDCITIIYGEYEAEGTHPVVQKLRNHDVPCIVNVCPGSAHAYPAEIVKRTKEIISDKYLMVHEGVKEKTIMKKETNKILTLDQPAIYQINWILPGG